MADDMGFKFNLNDVCRHVASGEEIDPERYFVIARFLEECHGGIQRFYVCRAVSRRGVSHREPIKIHENELVASAPYSQADEKEDLWGIRKTKENIAAVAETIKDATEPGTGNVPPT